MATATNLLIQGLSGMLGKTLVFKTIRGKTYVSSAPRKPDKRKETVAQRNTRTTFQQATTWAKTTLLNPAQKEYYHQQAKALGLPNAYTAAITEYMRNRGKPMSRPYN